MPSITSEEINQKVSFPVITVAMPVYNAGSFLRHAVLSIVKQTFTNWELLIIDDGSTDDALDSIADIEDSRIILIRDGHNKGLASRLNQAIDLARGSYFARMDQDDISYPSRFAKQVSALEDNPGLDLVSVRAIKISMQDQPVGYLPYLSKHDEITAAPWRGFYMPHPTWMGRIEWFLKHKYASPAPYLCEDQELLLRTYSSSKFLAMAEILFAYRVRDKINLSKLAKTRISVFIMQLSYFLATGKRISIFLAFGFLISRILLDLIKYLFPNSWFNIRLVKHDLEQWCKVHQLINTSHIST